MTFTLTADELKIAECGSINNSKFTDSTKGLQNIEITSNDNWGINGTSFTVQNALDKNFTLEQAKNIINSLITKNVINSKISFYVLQNDSNYLIKMLFKDSLDSDITTEQTKTYINNLLLKNVDSQNNITGFFTEDGKFAFKLTTEEDTYLKSCISSLTKIENKWMFVLTDEYINYIASQK